MIVVNDSRLPDSLVRPALVVAARSFRDAGVFVHVVDAAASGYLSRYLGRAHDKGSARRYVDRMGLKVGAAFEYAVEVVVPPEDRLRRFVREGVRLHQKHSVRRFGPSVPVASAFELIAYVAAHEFRHVYQFRRRDADIARGRRGRQCTEVDAEKWSVRLLSRFRVSDGRPAIPEMAGPPPFGPRGREGLLVCDSYFGVKLYAVKLGRWSSDRSEARVLRADVGSQAFLNRAARVVPFKSMRTRYEVIRWGA